MNRTNKIQGFTLIELLVVISIIALLSSVVLSSLNTARIRARDARRQADTRQIWTALNLFYDQYGCLPTPGNTACAGFTAAPDIGGWDYSSQGGSFMSFLETAGLMSRTPRDPVNNMPGDAAPGGTYSYRYYCYPAGVPPVGVHLGYWLESTGAYVMVNNTQSGGWADDTYICK